MMNRERYILSNLHDTLFLKYDTTFLSGLLENIQGGSSGILEQSDKTGIIDALVEYAGKHYTTCIKGTSASFGVEAIHVFDGIDVRLTDAIMNIDMMINDENPATISDFYRQSPIDPDFMLKGESVVISNGSKLKINEGNIVVDDYALDESPEVSALQAAAIDRLSVQATLKKPETDLDFAFS